MPGTIQTDVLVIGGGSTGSGVARDAAMRGFSTLLVERRDLADGTVVYLAKESDVAFRVHIVVPARCTACSSSSKRRTPDVSV